MTALDRVIDALENHGSRVTGGGNRRQCQCPAHEDRAPSLSLTGIEGRALLYDHGGCDTRDVLAAIGLTTADLFDDPRGQQYAYSDGRIVHRSPEKKFRQSGHTNGISQLFRLPKVTEAIKNGTPIYIVEGEQDVLALEALGAVATTAPMGAGNWSKVDTAPLKGANIVIVPDRDQAGERWLSDVTASIINTARSVRVALAKTGKDAADHLAAGHNLSDLAAADTPAVPGHRSIKLTSAADITIRPVHWLWSKRIALGTLALLGGREGIGKSTVAYTIAADITRGRLPGHHEGQPRSVIVAATEDSWEHTIVPRLIAARADLRRIYRVDVATSEGVDTGLSLPRDLIGLEHAVLSVDAALVLLDPLLSRLDAKLDTHKDSEVRLALEPLVAIADRTNAAILGLIHVNKSGGTDPLTVLMASRAFAAVARAVLFLMLDPDDETTRLLGQPKNNLGPTDLPTLTFRIDPAHVADTDEGPVWTGRVKWQGDREQSIRDVLEASSGGSEERSATEEATDWLEDHLGMVGGTDDSAAVKTAGRKAGHAESAIHRARLRLKITHRSVGRPRKTFWSLPSVTVADTDPVRFSPGESEMNEMDEINGGGAHEISSVSPFQAPTRGETTCSACGWPYDSYAHDTACNPPEDAA